MTGGGERDRTDDLLLAKQALSQLSYTPQINWWARVDLNYRPHAYQACALTGLSYRPYSSFLTIILILTERETTMAKIPQFLPN